MIIYNMHMQCVSYLVYSKLKSCELFQTMEKSVDEDEHSLEMQMPFIAKIMQKSVIRRVF